MKWMLSGLLGFMFVASGCVTYTIDSKPQGLRVTINNIEQGFTPCEYSKYTDGYDIRSEITVAPPTIQQIQEYEQKNAMTVVDWTREAQSKTLYSRDGDGTVFFQFIQAEQPTNAEVVDTEKTADGQSQEVDFFIVDSKPQGLRVVIDQFEYGVTPCKLNRKDFLNLYRGILIEVEEPTKQQYFDYCCNNQKIVSLIVLGNQWKHIYSIPPGGTILFNFINSEYDFPETDEEQERVKAWLEEDSKKLERERAFGLDND